MKIDQQTYSIEQPNRIAHQLSEIEIYIQIIDNDIFFRYGSNGSDFKLYKLYKEYSLEAKLRHFLLNENYEIFYTVTPLVGILCCVASNLTCKLISILKQASCLEELEILFDIYGI